MNHPTPYPTRAMPLDAQLARAVPATLLWAAVPWGVLTLEGAHSGLLALVLLVAGVALAGVSAELLRVLGVPRAVGLTSLALALSVLYGVAVVFALDAGDRLLHPLPWMIAVALATVTAVLVVNIGRGVPVRLPLALVVVLAVLPIGTRIVYGLVEDRAEDDAEVAEMAATGLTPYLPEFAGVAPISSSTQESVDGETSLYVSYAPAGEVVSSLGGLRVEMVAAYDDSACDNPDLTTCRQEGDALVVEDRIIGTEIVVERDGATLVASFDPERAEGPTDPAEIAQALRDAPEVSYEELHGAG